MSVTNPKLSIHIEKEGVTIEKVTPSGMKSIKKTTVENIQRVISDNAVSQTPLLPSQWGCIKYASKNSLEFYAITVPQHIKKVSYDVHDSHENFAEYEIVVPDALWLLSFRKQEGSEARTYHQGGVYALKGQILSGNETVYRYPFSNTNSDPWLCWGSQSSYPNVNFSRGIMTVPDQFLSNPFNHDLDSQKFVDFNYEKDNVNVSVFRTNHLFQYIDDKLKEAKEEGTQYSFPNDILISENMNVQEAIDHFMSNRM
ncbi:hypothetical protein KLEB273_gp196 [Bacillus phage vB_BauM_KLEB27-3]|nr:hypothetical protein KLEB273_gp196 [Bacillus phage vB_BauM_KLEB27-3]